MIIQRLFSSKEQKARRRINDYERVKKLGLAGEVHSAADQASAEMEAISGVKNTAKKSGKDVMTLLKKSEESVRGAGAARVSRRDQFAKFLLGDKENALENKNTKEGMAAYQSNRIKKASELKKAKSNAKIKSALKKGGKIALATGGVVAAGIGAKKLADKKKAKKDDNSKK